MKGAERHIRMAVQRVSYDIVLTATNDAGVAKLTGPGRLVDWKDPGVMLDDLGAIDLTVWGATTAQLKMRAKTWPERFDRVTGDYFGVSSAGEHRFDVFVSTDRFMRLLDLAHGSRRAVLTLRCHVSPDGASTSCAKSRFPPRGGEQSYLPLVGRSTPKARVGVPAPTFPAKPVLMPRTQKLGTPRARALRRAMTPAEKRLWRHLDRVPVPGTHFRRQAPHRPLRGGFRVSQRQARDRGRWRAAWVRPERRCRPDPHALAREPGLPRSALLEQRSPQADRRGSRHDLRRSLQQPYPSAVAPTPPPRRARATTLPARGRGSSVAPNRCPISSSNSSPKKSPPACSAARRRT